MEDTAFSSVMALSTTVVKTLSKRSTTHTFGAVFTLRQGCSISLTLDTIVTVARCWCPPSGFTWNCESHDLLCNRGVHAVDSLSPLIWSVLDVPLSPMVSESPVRLPFFATHFLAQGFVLIAAPGSFARPIREKISS